MKNSAIFIDLENFYNSLRRYDQALAIKLIKSPADWLSSLRHYDQSGGEQAVLRNFVISKTYFGTGFLKQFEKHAKSEFSRTSFNNAGVELEFCRILTSDGKNAADIKLVVDCLSLISRYNRIDEVFILADDCDFLPLVTELRKMSCDVFVTSITPESSSDEYRKEIQRIGVGILEGNDFRNLLPITDEISAEFEVSKNDFEKIKAVLSEKANDRQGFLPLDQAAVALKAAFPKKKIENWWGYGQFYDFIHALASFASDWMRFDVTYQGLRIPNRILDLKYWNVESEMRDFVINVLVEIDNPIPFFAPHENSKIFDALATAVNKGGDTSQIVNRAMTFARQNGIALKFAEAEVMVKAINAVRAIVDAPSDDGETLPVESYLTVEPRDCARAWRTQIYRLAREPEFIRSEAGLRNLVSWFIGSDETPESAIASTQEDIAESAP